MFSNSPIPHTFSILCAACLLVVLTSGHAHSGEAENAWKSDTWTHFFGDDGLMGFKDADGKVVIPAIYELVLDYQVGRAFVEDEAGWHLIDEIGNTVGEHVFEDVRMFRNERAAVRIKVDNELLGGYINLNGEYIVEPKYRGYIHDYNDQYGCISGPSRSWFFDKQGRVIAEYAAIGRFHGGLMPVQTTEPNGLWCYVDDQLNPAIGPTYQMARSFSEGLAPVMPSDSEGMWGYVNSKFELVLPAIYEDAGVFSEGMAVIVMEGKAGQINPDGEIVIPCQYEMMTNFIHGRCAAKSDKGWIWLDKQGSRLTSPAPRDVALEGYNIGMEEGMIRISPPMGYGSPAPTEPLPALSR